MDWTLMYGFLIGIALFIIVWFVFVAPTERRDHQRRLELVRKRLAEHEKTLRAEQEGHTDREADAADDREPR